MNNIKAAKSVPKIESGYFLKEFAKDIVDGLIGVGDQIEVTFDGKPVLFDIIGIGVDTPIEKNPDAAYVTIQTHDLLEEMRFDGTRPYGSNIWETSDIRKYLNSEEFARRCPKLVENLVKVQKKNNSRGDTEDMFFLLSKDEYDPGITPYPLYEDQRNRVKFGSDNYTDCHWTRSANRSNAYGAWYVSSAGYVGHSTASAALRFAPACVLEIIY